MEWSKAKKLIISRVTLNTLLAPKSRYKRKVVLAPPYVCNSRRFKGLEGFNVQIGKSKFIDVPISMLEAMYNAAVLNNLEYTRELFIAAYPGLADGNGTPCYIHVVGQIFDAAGLVIRTGRSKYWFKNFLN